MSTPEIDPVTAETMEEDGDFAEEHTKPSHADEDRDSDESTPKGTAGDGGMDPHRHYPT
jgi:hypothetical protein